jgi:hypothetical protein
VAGPWIKLEKALYDDPRIWAMARQLAERDKAAGYAPQPHLRLVITCVGAVGKLWKTADEQVDEADILPFGPADIDELTGIEGFYQLLPAEWLQVIDAHSVKLPGYHTHNGTEAKKRASSAARQERYRTTHALPKRHK